MGGNVLPTCDPLILTPACREIIGCQPNSVLDIGVGYGKWGLLVREYTEVWRHHRLYPSDWQVMLHGVEIHEGYRNPVWKLYDSVIVMDALHIPSSWSYPHNDPAYDLCIMVDVIEHMPKPEAATLLEWLRRRCKKILISYSNHDQHGVGDNKHEDHVSKWKPTDFPNPKHLLAGDEKSWALYLLT